MIHFNLLFFRSSLQRPSSHPLVMVKRVYDNILYCSDHKVGSRYAAVARRTVYGPYYPIFLTSLVAQYCQDGNFYNTGKARHSRKGIRPPALWQKHTSGVGRSAVLDLCDAPP